MKTCPKCKLFNPPTAQRCDCGYDFESDSVEKSYLAIDSSPQAGNVDASNRAIKNAGIASTLITIGLFYYTLKGLIENNRVIDLILVAIPLLFVWLTYGVFKGSRASIVVVATFYVGLCALVAYTEPASLSSTVIWIIVFIYFLLKGVEGAFARTRVLAMKAPVEQ